MRETMPAALVRLIEDLHRLPGIGRKTATRLALFLLRRPAAEAQALARSLAELHGAIRLCSVCCAFSATDPCPVCADPSRDRGLVCVVEEASDLAAVEKSGTYRGLYHVLHGVLSPVDGIGSEELKVDLLVARARQPQIREVLIATSSTVPGEATAALLIQRLRGGAARISRLAFGIPMGMDIKYADEVTLARAIEGRRPCAPGPVDGQGQGGANGG
ncbi:MAG: recombination mediator RecR [Thermodesulfobacteriota bacterium]